MCPTYYVVLVGNPLSGVEVYGLFEREDEAETWGKEVQELTGNLYWITEVRDKES